MYIILGAENFEMILVEDANQKVEFFYTLKKHRFCWALDSRLYWSGIDIWQPIISHAEALICGKFKS